MKTRVVCKGVFLIFSVMAIQVQAQGRLNRLRAARLVPAPVISSQEKEFFRRYPTGTNDFGRSYQQQVVFDRDFKLQRFLGWKFGDTLDNYGIVKLAKPFRMFETVNLRHSAKNRLCEIGMEFKAKDYSAASISNELIKLTAVFRKQYGFSIPEPKWSTFMFIKTASSKFSNNNSVVEIYGCYGESGDGEIKVTVCNRNVQREDQKIKDEEDRLARIKKERSISIPDDVGSDMLVAKRPSVSSEPKEVKFGETYGKVGPEELLEPILPLEEAVKLAKKDDPKGFYQMAIIISRRRNWRDREFDADLYAKECWKRAVTAGYKNALAVDALLKDGTLRDECQPGSYRCDELATPRQLAEKYSGIKISSWCTVGSLASPEDVDVQRKRYTDVIKMGYPQMTNALAFLEWRVARVAAKKAKEAVAKADSDELAELVKSVITLPKKETQKERSAKIAAKAKTAGSVYLRTTGEETMATCWDDKQGKTLVVEFLDAYEGYTRELHFSADGKLKSVSSATSD